MNSPISKKFNKGAVIVLGAFLVIALWGIFVPYSLTKKPEVVYTVQKGANYKAIGVALEKQGIVSSHGFFSLYVLLTLNYGKLQAGDYSLSPSMSVAQIAKKLSSGDVTKNIITIIEGWDLKDIANYLDAKKIYATQDFMGAAKKDFSNEFDFLKDKPKKLNLEGYIFPDTYQFSLGQTPDQLVQTTLANFDKKLTPDLRKEILAQHKTVFQIVTMASILEKEVQSLSDKKMVAGILWKRIKAGMPLQVDATINFITGKYDAGAAIKDSNIDSLYNTYKYAGLPEGPISSPGMDSIMAAIYPTDSPYWYYLSANRTGKTIFSKTLDEHHAAMAKYLKP